MLSVTALEWARWAFWLEKAMFGVVEITGWVKSQVWQHAPVTRYWWWKWRQEAPWNLPAQLNQQASSQWATLPQKATWRSFDFNTLTQASTFFYIHTQTNVHSHTCALTHAHVHACTHTKKPTKYGTKKNACMPCPSLKPVYTMYPVSILRKDVAFVSLFDPGMACNYHQINAGCAEIVISNC